MRRAVHSPKSALDSETLKAVADAFRQEVGAYIAERDVVLTHNARTLWPSQVSVTAVAYVQTACPDIDTRLCALGVGMRPEEPQENEGTAAHRFVLPRVERRLRNAGVVCYAERRFAVGDLVGVADLVIPGQCVVEFKTATERRGTSLTVYEYYQVALYYHATRLYPVVVIAHLASGEVTLVVPPQDTLRWALSRVAETLDAYSALVSKAPTVLAGRCEQCPVWDCDERRVWQGHPVRISQEALEIPARRWRQLPLRASI